MKWTFMVNRWFDRDDGDGAIERLLVPEVPQASMPRPSLMLKLDF